MFEELQPLIPIATDILKYALYGAEASLLGYLKSEELPDGWKALFTKEFWSSFDLPKAMKTVFVAFFLGIITRGTFYVPAEITQSPDFVALSLFLPSMIVLGVETLLKILFRRTPLMAAWNDIKDAAVGFLEKVTESK